MMKPVLNPKYTITRHTSTIILHNSRLVGTAGIVRSISSAEAVILSLYNGRRTPTDISRWIASVPGYNQTHADSIITITDAYLRAQILVDSETIRDKALPRYYDPFDFTFDADVLSAGQRLERPLGFIYIVTSQCNRLCRYCYAGSNANKGGDLISLQKIKRLIDEAHEIGIRSVSLSGGEPFLRKDLVEIIAYLLKKQIFPSVSTKAALSERVVRALCQAGLSKIQVSIDSANPTIANALAGSENFYEQILKTIQTLVRYGIEVNLNCVVTRLNVRDIPSLLTLAAALKVKGVGISPYDGSLGRHDDNLAICESDRKWLEETLINGVAKYPSLVISSPYGIGRDGASGGRPKPRRCSIGSFSFILLPDGKVSICERLAVDRQFVVGDLNNNSIMEMWTSPAWLKFTEPDQKKYVGTPCYACEMFSKCTSSGERCFVNTIVAYGRRYGPDPVSCPRIN